VCRNVTIKSLGVYADDDPRCEVALTKLVGTAWVRRTAVRGGGTKALPEIAARAAPTDMAREAVSRLFVVVMVPLMVPFGVALAVNVTGDPTNPVADADTVWEPGSRPRVNWVSPTPFASLGELDTESEPPPVTTAQLTFTPGTGFPWESDTLTLSGVGSVVAAGPVWLLPPADAI
jgi:hypothetical protein